MIDKLHYISQPAPDGTHLTAISQALKAGCKWIQLRIKDEIASSVLTQAIAAAKLCSSYNAKLIINDFPEIALEAGAYGVHLGLDDMPIAKAKEIVGNNLMIGGTANTFQHIQQRVAEGVDYIGLGPYRFTTTKKKLSPVLGLDGYTSILQKMKNARISTPIIAIGGIETEDIAAIMQTGVYGIAMSGTITRSTNGTETVQAIFDHLNSIQHA